MASVFSYLITMLVGLFWLIRVIICACFSLQVDIGIVPLNFNIEIILLFVTLICLILIIKRNIFGALVYFIANGLYFGDDVYIGITKIIAGQTSIIGYVSFLLSFLGVILAFITVIDIFINKDRRGSGKDKKTDWFYTNKEYERKHDERADENQYKF